MPGPWMKMALDNRASDAKLGRSTPVPPLRACGSHFRGPASFLPCFGPFLWPWRGRSRAVQPKPHPPVRGVKRSPGPLQMGRSVPDREKKRPPTLGAGGRRILILSNLGLRCAAPSSERSVAQPSRTVLMIHWITSLRKSLPGRHPALYSEAAGLLLPRAVARGTSRAGVHSRRSSRPSLPPGEAGPGLRDAIAPSVSSIPGPLARGKGLSLPPRRTPLLPPARRCTSGSPPSCTR